MTRHHYEEATADELLALERAEEDRYRRIEQEVQRVLTDPAAASELLFDWGPDESIGEPLAALMRAALRYENGAKANDAATIVYETLRFMRRMRSFARKDAERSVGELDQDEIEDQLARKAGRR